jgi:hypothetical protein
MVTKEDAGSGFIKHGLCAITIAALLAVAVVMAGKVFDRSMADFVSQAQNVTNVAFIN